MKTVRFTYHEASTEGGNDISIVVDNDDEVQLLDARKIAGTDTRWQFAIKSEDTARSQHDGH